MADFARGSLVYVNDKSSYNSLKKGYGIVINVFDNTSMQSQLYYGIGPKIGVIVYMQSCKFVVAQFTQSFKFNTIDSITIIPASFCWVITQQKNIINMIVNKPVQRT